jgi:hypothetical protein
MNDSEHPLVSIYSQGSRLNERTKQRKVSGAEPFFRDFHLVPVDLLG